MHLATAQAVAARPSEQPDPRETCMEPRKIISREEWTVARIAFLARETAGMTKKRRVRFDLIAWSSNVAI
jgi:hypothetical protein